MTEITKKGYLKRSVGMNKLDNNRFYRSEPSQTFIISRKRKNFLERLKRFFMKGR